MDEIQALEEVNTPHGKWWVPVVWSCNLVKQSRKESRIADDFSMKTVLDVRKVVASYHTVMYGRSNRVSALSPCKLITLSQLDLSSHMLV